MATELLPVYHASRDLGRQPFRSACYAPFTSLYFDSWGFVRACCQNWTHPLGHVGQATLAEIWEGARAEELRRAVQADDLSQGCQYCAWQVADGAMATVFARNFDRFPARAEPPRWPAQMEFSLSNTCNLACGMCNGEWSSVIRSKREQLPPLPKAYGERFFAELVPFLPQLEQAKFLGGEPFLAAESLRVFELLIEADLGTPCHVTTNATQWNARVERILDALPVSVSVSLDGATAETFEGIRRGARFAEVRENFARFAAYARRRGTYLGLTYCLMPQNWFEFGKFLLWADEQDCEVIVNTVIHPERHSLYHLPPAELAPIVRSLETEAESLVPRLGRNRQRFLDELTRWQQRLAHAGKRPLDFVPRRTSEGFPERGPAPSADGTPRTDSTMRMASAARADTSAPVDTLETQVASSYWLDLDREDRVVGASPLWSSDPAWAGIRWLDRPWDEVLAALRLRFGGIMELGPRQPEGPTASQELRFTSASLESLRLATRLTPRYDARGELVGTRWSVALPPAPTPLTASTPPTASDEPCR